MSNDLLRLICAALLGFSLLILFKNWEEFNKVSSVPKTAADSISQSSIQPSIQASASENEEDIPVPSITLKNRANIETETNLIATGKSSVVEIETDWIIAKISSNGGNLINVKLKKHFLDEAPFPLLENFNRRYIAQSGLVGSKNLPNHNTSFSFIGEEKNLLLEEGQDSITLSLVAELENTKLIKEYTFYRSKYLINVKLITHNTGESASPPLLGYFQLSHDGNTPHGYSSLLPTFFGAAIYTEESKFVKVAFDDIEDESYPSETDNGWIGIIQRYFASLWIPPTGSREFYLRRKRDNGILAGVILPLGSIESHQTQSISSQLYVGAQEQDILEQLDEEQIAPGVNLVVDYGWLTFIAVPLFALLSFIQSWVINWGVAIILLTFTIKLLFFPLSSAAYRSMAKMKELGPKVKELQNKFSGDKQRLQQEMMSLYREKKINPVGGCLPILVQIPVFIALYWVLLGSVELREAPFILWIEDMSTPDPYYVLPVIMGATMFLQTSMSPPPPDPTQAMIIRIMPIGFALFSLFFPSGLVLYWIVNTTLSILQQWYITRTIKKSAQS